MGGKKLIQKNHILRKEPIFFNKFMSESFIIKHTHKKKQHNKTTNQNMESLVDPIYSPDPLMGI